MKILVTGATGKLGSKIVESLLKMIPASELAVSVRNPEKAEDLRKRGVEVRYGDFDLPETLDTAFKGIDRLLIISADGDNETRIHQHTNAVQAAERAQVKFIAYTSLANATESQNLMAPPHVATEAAIVKTGIPYSFLRNNWYLENEISSIQGAIAGATWITSAGKGKVGWALQQDYADAAAAVLVESGHENTVYELSGPLLTQDELVSALGKVLNKEIPVQQVSDEEYAEIMKSLGLPEFIIPLLVGIQESIRNGSLDVESNDFEKVLGRPVTPISDALAKLI
ncbi:SDR family oxidoreductase [Alkalihalobacillus trypoxylicola]|uniref:NAD(P)-dependent oxidoreductase n=1 Tax=Alkalihalobacillus trypoxylicola TaxID=519424 RepID=A0A161PF92_9BACI|nr:SDR family oxidoreductase [Alkalihalobacillus trypoxylicola]KYG31777.1 NAD(P)-dependent oxidoreductase [Alkalihalobacillus trypoxylicola]